MERGDFISGEAWCRYKFERESDNEKIQRLQKKLERVSTELRWMVSNFEIAVVAFALLSVLFFARY